MHAIQAVSGEAVVRLCVYMYICVCVYYINTCLCVDTERSLRYTVVKRGGKICAKESI